LLQPAQTELEGREAICIVPSEGLWELPFQALISKSNKYVLEDHALSYAPALTVLREMKRKPHAQHGTSLTPGSRGYPTRPNASASPTLPRLLALGNPSSAGQSVPRLSRTRSEISFDSLPQAEQEVKTIGEIY